MSEMSYEAPTITDLGTISDLTQGTTSITPDTATLGAPPVGTV